MQAKSREHHQVSLGILRKYGQIHPLFIRKLDMSRVQQLVESSSEKGRELMAVWKENAMKQKFDLA